MSEELPDDWSWKPLGEFAEVVSGGTPPKTEPSYWEGGTIPWATPSDITKTSGRVIFDTEEKITDLGLSASAASRLPAGSILMTSRATLGEARIAAVPTATNQGFKSLVPKAHIDNWYLFYQIQNSKARYSVFGKGTTFLEVNTKDTLRLPIPYCPKDEQRRIATILTTLDEEIEATEALIAKHQQIKAGLMHDLFTRGLWTQAELARGDHKGLPCEASAKAGHLRPTPEEAPGLYQDSPLGLIPKEWKVVRLDQCVPESRPIVYGILMPGTGYEGGIPVIKVKDIREEKVDLSDILLTSPEIDQQYARAKTKAGDILFTIRGTVGRVAIVPDELDGANITQDTARISASGMNSKFLLGFLTSQAASKYAEIHTLGVAVQGINLGELRSMTVIKPKRDEQDKIGERLLSIIERIDSEKEHLAKLRHQKQGLMHDLLTGRVRVDCQISASKTSLASR